MKFNKESLYQLLGVTDNSYIKVGGGTYQINGTTLKHIKGNANYSNLLQIFERGEEFTVVNSYNCTTNCTNCPLRCLDCLDTDMEMPKGIPLYAILETITKAYKDEDTYHFFKAKIDEFIAKELSEEYRRGQ